MCAPLLLLLLVCVSTIMFKCSEGVTEAMLWIKDAVFALPATTGPNTEELFDLQERKLRAHQKLDGLPPWTIDCDAALTMARTRATRALCFVTVKQ